MQNRIDTKFEALKAKGRAAFVTFVTAADPDLETSTALITGMANAGADILEIGMPFTDPSADGPAIDAAAQRALKAGGSMINTFKIVRAVRKSDDTTPIVLMGYFNPIHAYGIERFAVDAAEVGVDGLIIVDLPPEEDAELRTAANKNGVHFIRLATPTTRGTRLDTVLDGASGFLYYVAVAGITGGKSADEDDIKNAMAAIKAKTDVPVCVGFGIRTPEQAANMARLADGAVVGSAIVDIIAKNIDNEGCAKAELVDQTLDFVKKLAEGVASTS